MVFSKAVETCLRKYASFSGRASRSEFWLFFVFVVLVGAFASLLSSIVESVWRLAIALPLLAAGWRRLHDTGLPGWIVMVPIVIFCIGLAVALASLDYWYANSARPVENFAIAFAVVMAALLVVLAALLARPSQPGPNKYGPNPNEVTP